MATEEDPWKLLAMISHPNKITTYQNIPQFLHLNKYIT